MFCWPPPHSFCFSPLQKAEPCRGGGNNQEEISARKKHSSPPQPAQGCKARKGEYKGGTRRGLEQPRFVPRLKATQQTWTWMSLLFLFPPLTTRGWLALGFQQQAGAWAWAWAAARPCRGHRARPARACRAGKCPVPSSYPIPAVLLNPRRPSRY